MASGRNKRGKNLAMTWLAATKMWRKTGLAPRVVSKSGLGFARMARDLTGVERNTSLRNEIRMRDKFDSSRRHVAVTLPSICPIDLSSMSLARRCIRQQFCPIASHPRESNITAK
jgi:hypothetical protein